MHEEIATEYAVFGSQWAVDTSPLYAAWAAVVAGDQDLLALLAGLPPAKRQPNLVFAAARWEGAPLDPGPRWRDWLISHWPAVAATALARRTQTNEPNRCATLLPAFDAFDGPLALVEVGASAGLCLLPDRYGYRYDAPAGARMLAADRPAVMRCRTIGGAAPPTRLPEVVWRRGIDLDPIDVTDRDAVRWLETLVWPGPDHDARVGRLAAAAGVAAADPPEIVQGDLLEVLEDVARSAPPDATLVVFHSAVAMYLSPADRHRFVGLVSGLGARLGRRVVWVAQETSSVLGIRLPAGTATDGRFVQSVDGVAVALAGQHGATFERLH